MNDLYASYMVPVRIIVFIVIFVGMSMWQSNQRLAEIENDWSTTNAVVKDVRKVSIEDKGETISMVTVDFDYKVGEKVHHSFDRFSSSNFPNMEAKYIKGTSFKVFYDPKNPSRNKLPEDIELDRDRVNGMLNTSITVVVVIGVIAYLFSIYIKKQDMQVIDAGKSYGGSGRSLRNR